VFFKKVFQFYFLILTKMNDYFIQFMNSNINFLITHDLYLFIEQEQYLCLNNYFKFSIKVFAKNELLNLLETKSLKSWEMDKLNYRSLLKEWLDRDIFCNNKIYDKTITKFTTFFYLLTINVILGSIYNNEDEDLQRFDLFLKNIENINPSLGRSLVIKEINEFIK